jgi:hypothetical protein
MRLAPAQSTEGSPHSLFGVAQDMTAAAEGAPQPQHAAAGQIPSALQ